MPKKAKETPKKSSSSSILAFRKAWILAEALQLIDKPPSRKRKKTLRKIIKESEKGADLS